MLEVLDRCRTEIGEDALFWVPPPVLELELEESVELFLPSPELRFSFRLLYRGAPSTFCSLKPSMVAFLKASIVAESWEWTTVLLWHNTPGVLRGVTEYTWLSLPINHSLFFTACIVILSLASTVSKPDK